MKLIQNNIVRLSLAVILAGLLVIKLGLKMVLLAGLYLAGGVVAFVIASIVLVFTILGAGMIYALLAEVCASGFPNSRSGVGFSLRTILKEAARLKTCGELAEPPGDWAHRAQMRYSRFVAWVFVGKITIIGKEKLAGTRGGPFMLGMNHVHPMDIAIPNIALDCKARQPANQLVMAPFFGLFGWLFSKFGVVAVDLKNGGKAREAMAKVMTQGENVLLFPSGGIWIDGDIGDRPYKTGTYRSALLASENRRSEGLGAVSIVPGYMLYGAYPGAWINKISSLISWIVPLMFFPVYRRGVTFVFGDPIDTFALQDRALREATPELDEAHTATAIIKDAIAALKPLHLH